MKQHYNYILNEALLHYNVTEKEKREDFERKKNENIVKIKNEKISVFKWFNNIIQKKIKSVFGTKLTVCIVFIIQSLITYYPFISVVGFVFNNDLSGLWTYLIYLTLNYFFIKYIGEKFTVIDQCRLSQEQNKTFENSEDHISFSDFSRNVKINEKVRNYLANRTPKKFLNELISSDLVGYNKENELSNELTYEELLNYMITY